MESWSTPRHRYHFREMIMTVCVDIFLEQSADLCLLFKVCKIDFLEHIFVKESHYGEQCVSFILDL